MKALLGKAMHPETTCAGQGRQAGHAASILVIQGGTIAGSDTSNPIPWEARVGKLPSELRGVIRQFTINLANGYFPAEASLDDVPRADYLAIFDEPSACEQAMAIFLNHLSVGPDGRVQNARRGSVRAGQYLRAYLVEDDTLDPPLEDWEQELHPPFGSFGD